ncbi:MAG: thioredoxin family protein [Pseudomonadota bacterium]|nr:thioredoxin family protein [Pseudomonadota bacterium]
MQIPISWRTLLLTALLCTATMPLLGATQDIYPAPEQAAGDLAAALQTSKTTRQRVIVDFGGNWCPDCHALDSYFHDAANAPLLQAHFILVHVNVGRMDQNRDIAAKYAIPLAKGVPALAVLDADGNLLHSQKTGEFESMRHMRSSAVTEFLKAWTDGP